MTSAPAAGPDSLVADVGATNARFAWAESDGRLAGLRSLEVADFPSFTDALDDYLRAEGGARRCAALAVAAAGPVAEGCVELTNAPWRIEAAALARHLGGARVRVLNDLEAVALALPHLGPGDLAPVGPPREAPERAVRLALNVGTGFGGAAIVPLEAGGWVALPAEPGHMGLAVPAGLLAELPELGAGALATVEDALSGSGVLRLHRLLSGEHGGDADHVAVATEVFAAAGRDATARRTLHAAGALLAAVAGDLALATGAWGGVYLTGGVVDGLAPHLDGAAFRRRFAGQGKMAERLEAVPVAVITRDNVALLGLASALDAGPGN